MQTHNEEKTLSLFYSNDPASNLLALEIVKHISDFNVDIFIPSMIVSYLTANNINDATEFLNFLEPHLTPHYIRNLKRLFYQPYTWKEVLATTDKERREKLEWTVMYQNLYIFEKSLQTEIIFTLYKRTKSEVAISCYLKADQGKHFARKEIFNHFLDCSDKISSLKEFKIPGLFPEEIETYLKRVYPNISCKKAPQSLAIQGIKSPKVPEILFNKKFEEVHINFFYSKAFFPDYIFRFQGLKKLRLEIDSDTQIPENWSSLFDLEELEFYGEDHVFKNFDFVKSLIKLKSLDISHHYISDPSFLLSNTELPIIRSFHFKSIEDFSSYADEKTFLLPKEETFEIANALGGSYYLSLEEKKYYFKKFIKNKRLKDLETLSIDELLAMKIIDESDKYEELKGLINEQIEAMCDKQKSLDSLNQKSLLYIAGYPESCCMSVIEEQLTDLKISFYTSPDSTPFENITHLVLCDHVSEYKQIQGHKYKLISEKALLKHLKINENES